ncbi:hypothetical protein [Mycobacteroides chelonae]|uniref:hypothetical protein n=1 Tax=Mycobacteroides chelonae TaxID=1774 RepID=UPI0012FF71A4|nr:hypothetical protein [Mycobacteroides chelonae]
MDEYAEDLPGPALPAWVEEYLAGERAWWRRLRATGLVASEDAAEGLARWINR